MEDILDEEGEWGGVGIMELEGIPKVLGGEGDKGGKFIELYNGQPTIDSVTFFRHLRTRESTNALFRSKMMNGIVALHSPPMRKYAVEKNGTLFWFFSKNSIFIEFWVWALSSPYFHISSNIGLLPFRRQGLEPYCERDASRARLLEMRLFGEAKLISGHQTLQLMRRPYGVKRNVYVVILPAFQRCLEDGPDVAEQRSGSGFPTGRGTGDGHLKAHHDIQATPTRPGKATRLGVRGSIVPAASRTSYSSFWKVRGRDLYSSTEKKGADYFLLNDIQRSRQFP
ncbi:ATP synthase F1 subunit alpha [Capsicum annuum]|nr:ATP synthase F1 subunit alpha [Capsicum annuum]